MGLSGKTYLVGPDRLLVLRFINLFQQLSLLRRSQLLSDSGVPLPPGCHKGKQCRGAPHPGGTRPAGSPAQTAAGFCPSRLTAGTTGTHQPSWPRWSAGQVSWEEGGGQNNKARGQASGIWKLKLQTLTEWWASRQGLDGKNERKRRNRGSL